jgi:hypothetical protein
MVALLDRPPVDAASWAGNFNTITPEWISSHELALGYGAVNLALGVPLGTQRRTDELIWNLGEKCYRTANHGRRVGGYAGAVVREVGGPNFGTDYHIGIMRIIGGVHDIGKLVTEEVTLHRTFGDPGYGEWDEAVDLPNIWPHAEDGAQMVEGDSQLPEETPLGIGCHHQYPDPTKPERPIYGRRLATIDEVYKNQPQMRAWGHLMVKSLVAGDTYDAVTSRANTYLSPGDSAYKYMLARLKPLFPEQHERVLGALQREHVHYLRGASDSDISNLIAA